MNHHTFTDLLLWIAMAFIIAFGFILGGLIKSLFT